MYHRRELWLLFLFALALAVGSLVQHLRHNFPELAQRLESVDQEEQNPAASTQISRAPEAFPSRPQKLSRSDRPESSRRRRPPAVARHRPDYCPTDYRGARAARSL